MNTPLDISVLLLFFNRADHFSRVWEEVKKARPARLFLYQDGPRMINSMGEAVSRCEDSKDWAGMMECRSLVEDIKIDWPCEVHRKYLERNEGCDPSGFKSHRWAFSQTDKCIVLEDDVVPSQSFFKFCKEMLDRYEDDERITMIAGFNTDEDSTPYLLGDRKEFTHPADYFFTRVFSIWGWASWSHVVNHWDADYQFVHNKEQLRTLQTKANQYRQRKDMVRMCQDHAQLASQGKPYFESIFWAYMMLHDGLAIMPRLNMINNVGMEGGTHFSAQMELLPKRMRKQFAMQRHELPMSTNGRLILHHPDSVAEYSNYQERHYLLNAWNAPWRKVQYSLEELWLNLRHGNWKKILCSLSQRIKKTLGLNHHH